MELQGRAVSCGGEVEWVDDLDRNDGLVPWLLAYNGVSFLMTSYQVMVLGLVRCFELYSCYSCFFSFSFFPLFFFFFFSFVFKKIHYSLGQQRNCGMDN